MASEEFDAEVYQVEDEVITQLMASPLFSNKDEFFVKMLGLFITRKELTQEKIHKITGISTGKISEELKHFNEDGLIEIAHISEKGKITYRSKSASITLIKFSISITEKLVEWRYKLKDKFEELVSNRDRLLKLKGYNRLIELYSFMINEIDKYENFIDKANEILSKLENNE